MWKQRVVPAEVAGDAQWKSGWQLEKSLPNNKRHTNVRFGTHKKKRIQKQRYHSRFHWSDSFDELSGVKSMKTSQELHSRARFENVIVLLGDPKILTTCSEKLRWWSKVNGSLFTFCRTNVRFGCLCNLTKTHKCMYVKMCSSFDGDFGEHVVRHRRGIQLSKQSINGIISGDLENRCCRCRYVRSRL